MSPDAGPEHEGKKPSRALAIVLGVVGPFGTGQLYLGQTRRAVSWFASFVVGFLVATFSLPPLGALLGYGQVLALVIIGAVLAWLASVLDLLAIPEARINRVRWLELVGFWLVAWMLSLALRAVIRSYAIAAFKTPSGSMQPTLLLDEHVLATKTLFLRLPPRRGEAIIFRYPGNPDLEYLKRVIALPGDSMEVKRGHPWLNGWEVPHCQVGKTTLPDAKPGCSASGTLELEFLEGAAYLVFVDECTDDGKQGPYHVAPGEVWVLGDNRNSSFDSRFWFGGRGGGVPLANVTGRPLFRWFSPTEWSRYGTAIADPLLPKSMAALGPEVARCLARRPSLERTTPPRPQ